LMTPREMWSMSPRGSRPEESSTTWLSASCRQGRGGRRRSLRPPALHHIAERWRHGGESWSRFRRQIVEARGPRGGGRAGRGATTALDRTLSRVVFKRACANLGAPLFLARILGELIDLGREAAVSRRLNSDFGGRQSSLAWLPHCDRGGPHQRDLIMQTSSIGVLQLENAGTLPQTVHATCGTRWPRGADRTISGLPRIDVPCFDRHLHTIGFRIELHWSKIALLDHRVVLPRATRATWPISRAADDEVQRSCFTWQQSVRQVGVPTGDGAPRDSMEKDSQRPKRDDRDAPAAGVSSSGLPICIPCRSRPHRLINIAGLGFSARHRRRLSARYDADLKTQVSGKFSWPVSAAPPGTGCVGFTFFPASRAGPS